MFDSVAMHECLFSLVFFILSIFSPDFALEDIDAWLIPVHREHKTLLQRSDYQYVVCLDVV